MNDDMGVPKFVIVLSGGSQLALQTCLTIVPDKGKMHEVYNRHATPTWRLM